MVQRKRRFDLLAQVRVGGQVAEYLSSLTGEARASWMREALEAYYVLEGDRASARVLSLRAEAERIEKAAEDRRILLSTREAAARNAIVAALARINPPYWGDLPTMDIGKAILEEHRIDRAFMQSVIKEAQGQ